MHTFKQFLSEAVPNRFHGQVFKQFYDMGRRGTYPWSSELISKISNVATPENKLVNLIFGGSRKKSKSMGNEDAPSHMMRFPSFKNDSIGRILTIPVETVPTDLNKGDILGHHEPSTGINRIDLRKASGLSDILNILGHEAFHSVQTARGNEGEKKFKKVRVGNRVYHDSLGHIRTTNDLQYSLNIGNPVNHIYKAIKQKQLSRGSGLSDNEVRKIQYQYNDHEHDARIGGAIARLAAKEGSRSVFARDGIPLFNYKRFLADVNPMTRRQERRTRKTFGRIAQEWQNITGKKINPDPEATDTQTDAPIHALGSNAHY